MTQTPPTEPYQQYPPPYQPYVPPPKRGWSRKKKVLVFGGAGLGAFLALTIGLSVSGSNTPAPAPTMPSTSAPAAATAAPAVVPTANPPFKSVTLLNDSNSGNQATPAFTSTTGDYLITWSYSGNVDPQLGIPVNFIINEDGSNDFNSVGDLPNDIAASGHGSAQVTDDAGTHTFNVQATGSWTVKVVSEP